jgi:hypothetical protein
VQDSRALEPARSPQWFHIAKTATNSLHEVLSARNQTVPGACRVHLQNALVALRLMRDLSGTTHYHAGILELEIMLQQRTTVKMMVPKVLGILEAIDRI